MISASIIHGQSSADPAIAKCSKKNLKILLYTLAYIKTYYLCLYWPTQQENYNNFITTTTNGPTMCGNRMCSDRRMGSETWNYDRSADRQMDRPTDRQCSREISLPTKKNTWVYASLYIELTEYNLYFYGRTGGRI